LKKLLTRWLQYFSELPPKLITPMTDTTVITGDRATFEIELSKGDAIVRWFKDDIELQFSEHVQLSIDGKRQKLLIYNCENPDAGLYSCKVGNEECSGRLKVEGKHTDQYIASLFLALFSLCDFCCPDL